MTRVKICGLAAAADVELAVRRGAWACGFVLSPSPRRVTPEHAATLTPLTGSAVAVAVVTTEPADVVVDALATGGFDAVQLSAGADGPAVQAVREAARGRGLRPLVIAAADTSGADTADLVLLDSRAPGLYGGTGDPLDWRALAARELSRDRLVLAGGLRPSNVEAAISLVRPFAVDVSSGVERSAGLKDARLVDAFFEAVVAADDAGLPEEVRP